MLQRHTQGAKSHLDLVLEMTYHPFTGFRSLFLGLLKRLDEKDPNEFEVNE